jgi:hypothetical protein
VDRGRNWTWTTEKNRKEEAKAVGNLVVSGPSSVARSEYHHMKITMETENSIQAFGQWISWPPFYLWFAGMNWELRAKFCQIAWFPQPPPSHRMVHCQMGSETWWLGGRMPGSFSSPLSVRTQCSFCFFHTPEHSGIPLRSTIRSMYDKPYPQT